MEIDRQDGGLGLPTNIHIVYSENCNLRCRHCDLWKTSLPDMPLEELKSQIVNLKSWLGSFTLHISGKEPFMRSDIYDLLGFCKDNSVPVSILSNGTLLIPERIFPFKNILSISISIDGIGEVHDRIRGVAGTFEIAARNIRRLISLGIYPTILTTIQRDNMDDLVDIVLWAEREGLQVLFGPLHQNLGQKKIPGWWKESPVWPSELEMYRIIEMKKEGFPILNSIKHLEIMKRYYQQPSENAKLCDVGKSHFIIDKGKVHLCFYRKAIAALGEPKTIWFSDKASKERKSINCCMLNCNIDNCYYIDEK